MADRLLTKHRVALVGANLGFGIVFFYTSVLLSLSMGGNVTWMAHLPLAAVFAFLAYRFELWPGLVASLGYLVITSYFDNLSCMADARCVGEGMLWESWVAAGAVSWIIAAVLASGILAGVLRSLRIRGESGPSVASAT